MDLEEQREVDSQAVRELLEKFPSVQHLQASAKEKSGVRAVFEKAALASVESKKD